MGGTEGHPKERPGESKRGGHPGHTDKTKERERGRLGGIEMKGERDDVVDSSPVSISAFLLVRNRDADQLEKLSENDRFPSTN